MKKIKEFIRKIFSPKKDDLREKCVQAYGEDFGIMYDMINQGQAIGGFIETTIFLEMLEAVRSGHPMKLKENK